MAKPNYAFQKRQRELAKKQKKEEKRQRKDVPDVPDDAGESAIGPAADAPPVRPPEDGQSPA